MIYQICQFKLPPSQTFLLYGSYVRHVLKCPNKLCTDVNTIATICRIAANIFKQPLYVRTKKLMSLAIYVASLYNIVRVTT